MDRCWLSFVVSMFLFVGCSAICTVKPVREVEIIKWNTPPIPVYDSLTVHPLNNRLRKTAIEAQQALLKRITGKYPEIFDARFFRTMPRPLYVVADMPITLPVGPPKFILAKSEVDLAKLATETQTDIYSVKMETVGTTIIRGRRTVVMHYSFGVIDWEVARWNTLNQKEKAQQTKPDFREWLFGGGGYFGFVRRGAKLLIYEAPFYVS